MAANSVGRSESVGEPAGQQRSEPAELLLKKYGDVRMLELLNAIVSNEAPTPKIQALADAYMEKGDGRGGGKEDFIKKIIADYGRAARMTLYNEFGFVNGVVMRKREKRAASR